MTDIKNDKKESLNAAKAEKNAEKLNKAIQTETEKFNEKIKKLGAKAGMNLSTEVHIIIK